MLPSPTLALLPIATTPGTTVPTETPVRLTRTVILQSVTSCLLGEGNLLQKFSTLMSKVVDVHFRFRRGTCDALVLWSPMTLLFRFISRNKIAKID